MQRIGQRWIVTKRQVRVQQALPSLHLPCLKSKKQKTHIISPAYVNESESILPPVQKWQRDPQFKDKLNFYY